MDYDSSCSALLVQLAPTFCPRLKQSLMTRWHASGPSSGMTLLSPPRCWQPLSTSGDKECSFLAPTGSRSRNASVCYRDPFKGKLELSN